jgi:N-acetylneuraminate synthase/N,N'-diacetyllegionaminate synthase
MEAMQSRRSSSVRRFQPTFQIGSRSVGEGRPVFVIAEAGVSHFGDMDLARKLVDLAASAKADAFKTQLFDVEALISKHAPEWRDRLRPRNLTLTQALELKQRCESHGVEFMATAHDETRIPWLKELDVPAVKVGSGERNNPAFLTRLARLSKPMIVSTGMYHETDVLEAVDACAKGSCVELALLHCVTSYPTPPNEVNLRAMDRLRNIFGGPVGYSDHTADGLAVLAAVACGASIIEKHITILRDVPNAQDWKVSAGPEDFGRLVADIRRVEALLGSGVKAPALCEDAGAQWALKSLVAARDLPVGKPLEPEDLLAKRPGTGMRPNEIARLLGRRLTRPLAADEPLRPEDVS